MQVLATMAHSSLYVWSYIHLLLILMGTLFCAVGFMALYELLRTEQELNWLGKVAIPAFLLLVMYVPGKVLGGEDFLTAFFSITTIIGVPGVVATILWCLGVSKSFHALLHKLHLRIPRWL